MSAEPTKVALLVWGTATGCPGGLEPCAAPVLLLCSGLLAPGTAWAFGGPALPPTATSAIAYSFNVRRLSAVGGPVPPDKPVADYLCGVLAAAVVGSCDNFGRFKTAYESGAMLGGVRLAFAYGGGLAVTVARRCPDANVKLPVVPASYSGVGGRAFGGRDRLFRWSSYYLPALEESAKIGRHALIHLQNGGPRCASVELWFRELGECHRTRLCRTLLVAPGAVVSVPGTDCLRPDTRGTAWLRSSEPLAVVADLLSPEGRSSHGAVPAELQLAAGEPPVFTAGGSYLQSPLPPGRNGAETVVQVQNLSSVSLGTVRVTYLDRRGMAVAIPAEVQLCPRGTAALRVPDPPAAAAPAASVRVESVAWFGADGASTPATNISATVLQREAGSPGFAAPPGEAGPPGNVLLSYSLTGPVPSRSWPLDSGDRGARLLAVARLWNDAGDESRLAITNAVTEPGATNIVILVFDANGPLNSRCLQLGPGATAWLGGADLDVPGTAFRGSAVISAASWRHPTFDLRGRETGNRVGLAALVVTTDGDTIDRSGTPGDILSAEAGLPFTVDGPVHPYASQQPNCSPLPVGVEEPAGRRMYLPAVGR